LSRTFAFVRCRPVSENSGSFAHGSRTPFTAPGPVGLLSCVREAWP
jgi:hypothetical protein